MNPTLYENTANNHNTIQADSPAPKCIRVQVGPQPLYLQFEATEENRSSTITCIAEANISLSSSSSRSISFLGSSLSNSGGSSLLSAIFANLSTSALSLLLPSYALPIIPRSHSGKYTLCTYQVPIIRSIDTHSTTMNTNKKKTREMIVSTTDTVLYFFFECHRLIYRGHLRYYNHLCVND